MAEPRQTDRLLLLEAGLILLLVVLTVFLYWVPAARVPFAPRWYAPLVLGGLFFAILGLHSWRRRRGARSAMRQAILQDAQRRLDDGDKGAPA